MNDVLESYRKVQRLVGTIGYGREVQEVLLETMIAATAYTTQANRIELKSKVNGKSYFGFSHKDSISRPINRELYMEDQTVVHKVITALFDRQLSKLTATQINQAIYTSAVTFCAGIDIMKKGDQKTPGTFFEYLMSSVLAALLDSAPQTSVQVLNLDFETRLPTDLIFDLGPGQAKYHVPVKTSTRERVIQVWAHQRVLDGVYGTGRFLGMPIILAETKLDSKKREVTEICLPKQWLLYQMHIAQLWRIAFLDLPEAYSRLKEGFPRVPVCTLGDLLCGSDLPITSR